jgi:hypothetical protein
MPFAAACVATRESGTGFAVFLHRDIGQNRISELLSFTVSGMTYVKHQTRDHAPCALRRLPRLRWGTRNARQHAHGRDPGPRPTNFSKEVCAGGGKCSYTRRQRGEVCAEETEARRHRRQERVVERTILRISLLSTRIHPTGRGTLTSNASSIAAVRPIAVPGTWTTSTVPPANHGRFSLSQAPIPGARIRAPMPVGKPNIL